MSNRPEGDDSNPTGNNDEDPVEDGEAKNNEANKADEAEIRSVTDSEGTEARRSGRVQGANLRGSRTVNSKPREGGMARRQRSDLKTESRMTPSRATILCPLLSGMKTSVMKNTRRN